MTIKFSSCHSYQRLRRIFYKMMRLFLLGVTNSRPMMKVQAHETIKSKRLQQEWFHTPIRKIFKFYRIKKSFYWWIIDFIVDKNNRTDFMVNCWISHTMGLPCTVSNDVNELRFSDTYMCWWRGLLLFWITYCHGLLKTHWTPMHRVGVSFASTYRCHLDVLGSLKSWL